jgi:hypothetical protein
MIFRILFGASLFALGYYIGKEIGRTEPIRNTLEKSRQQQEETLMSSEGESESSKTTE